MLLDFSLRIGLDFKLCVADAVPFVSALEHRYPGGKKVTFYRKAKLERFGLYLQSDGLITRLTTYKDLSCVCPRVQDNHLHGLFPRFTTFVLCVEGTEVELVKEWYQGRTDFLDQRELNKILQVTTERFLPGRSFHLLCKSTSCSVPVRA